MPSPLSVNKNNYFDKPKPSDIYTPEWLSKWLYELVSQSGMKKEVVLDPAIGQGSLTKWFKRSGSHIIGCDVDDNSAFFTDKFIHGKFEDIKVWGDKIPDFIIVNPPFNSASGRKLYPEVFLRKIDELFGHEIPVIMIVPMGLRLNQRLKSSRWRYIRNNWKINTIISLPIDAFDGVLFHAEILGFNVTGMNPSYFLPDEIIPMEKLIKANGKTDI
jgi:hypothetical protein